MLGYNPTKDMKKSETYTYAQNHAYDLTQLRQLQIHVIQEYCTSNSVDLPKWVPKEYKQLFLK